VILSEGSVGSGVRRIEAVTSGEAYAYLAAQADELQELRGEVERLRKESRLKAPPRREAQVAADVKVVNGVNVIAQSIDGLDADALLDLSDRFKQANVPAAVVLGSREDGRVHLVANFDQSVAERVSAADVVKAAAAFVGGGGGGRPTMARAGGKEPERLGEAIEAAESILRDRLS
jgi:alanyl-tRNA synthetase